MTRRRPPSIWSIVAFVTAATAAATLVVFAATAPPTAAPPPRRQIEGLALDGSDVTTTAPPPLPPRPEPIQIRTVDQDGHE